MASTARPGRTTPPVNGRIGPADESVTSPLRSKTPARNDADDVQVVDVDGEPLVTAPPTHLKPATFPSSGAATSREGGT